LPWDLAGDLRDRVQIPALPATFGPVCQKNDYHPGLKTSVMVNFAGSSKEKKCFGLKMHNNNVIFKRHLLDVST